MCRIVVKYRKIKYKYFERQLFWSVYLDRVGIKDCSNSPTRVTTIPFSSSCESNIIGIFCWFNNICFDTWVHLNCKCKMSICSSRCIWSFEPQNASKCSCFQVLYRYVWRYDYVFLKHFVPQISESDIFSSDMFLWLKSKCRMIYLVWDPFSVLPRFSSAQEALSVV